MPMPTDVKLFKIIRLSLYDFNKLKHGDTVIHELYDPFPHGWASYQMAPILRKQVDMLSSGKFVNVLVALPADSPKVKGIELSTRTNVIWWKGAAKEPPSKPRIDQLPSKISDYTWFVNYNATSYQVGGEGGVRVLGAATYGVRYIKGSDAVTYEFIQAVFQPHALNFIKSPITQAQCQKILKHGDKLPVPMDLDDMFIYHVLMRWARDPHTEDTAALDYIKVKPRYITKSPQLYRGIRLSESAQAKLKKGLPIFLENRDYSSWTDDPYIANGFGWKITKKTVKANIVISPYLFAEYYKLDQEGLMPFYEEKETIIRNTPYWLRVSPSEVEHLAYEDDDEFVYDGASKYIQQQQTPGLLTKLKKFFSFAFSFQDMAVPELEKLYLRAKIAYYNGNNPVMSDQEFDALEDLLRERAPNSPVLKQIGAPVKDKVRLPFHLGSLDKIKPGSTKLANWTKKTPGPYILMDKLDGISFYLRVRNGKPDMATTRGDGDFGQDISFLIPHLRLPNSKLPDLDLRGELIISKTKFQQYKQQGVANARNMASGIANSKSVHKAIKDVDIVIYEQLAPRGTPSQDFKKLKQLGFHVVAYITANQLDEQFLIEYLNHRRKLSDHEIDGIVIAQDHPNPLTSQGNPKHAVAFKQDLSEDQLPKATVVKVHWKLSDKGLIKPRLEITPVNLGGVTIRFTTAYNARWIKQNNVGPGTEVLIKRAGEVIPVVAKILKSTSPQYPDFPYQWDDRQVDLIP